MLKINKLIYLIFVKFMLILLINICEPVISSAITTATVYLESNKSIIEKGEEIEISFNIKEQSTAAYNANIYFDETKFEFISGPENINVNGNRIIIVWYDLQGGNGAKQGELGKLVFMAKDDGISNFVIDGEFFSDKGQSIQTNFEAVQVQVGKEETNLEMQARQEQGISQKKLEELSGVKQPVIARMEKGLTSPQLDTILKVLVPLGKTLAVVPLEKK